MRMPGTTRDGGLEIGPSLMYPAKAALTRARSLHWAVRGTAGTCGGLRILFYHRVSDDRDELAVKPERFADQMLALSQDGYTVLDVESIAARLRTGATLARTIGLSFDDGYADIADHALPVLRELGFRATVYVATEVIDGTAKFSWYRAQPPVLSWSQILALDAEGTFRFEPHTLTHPNLTTISDGQAEYEVAESRAVLEERLGRSVSSFCYPAGLFGARERMIVQHAGLLSAVSCEPGQNDAKTDRYALRRIQIDHRDAMVDFRAKVGGAHDKPTRLRAAYRRYRYGAAGIPPRVSSAR
jgi:peptidoglycan/xylan/chitin deacetylase (PgdA/CDA1 family)